METIKLAVLGLNQGSKIARDAKKNPEIELVAVAGFGEHDEQVAKELEVPITMVSNGPGRHEIIKRK